MKKGDTGPQWSGEEEGGLGKLLSQRGMQAWWRWKQVVQLGRGGRQGKVSLDTCSGNHSSNEISMGCYPGDVQGLVSTEGSRGQPPAWSQRPDGLGCAGNRGHQGTAVSLLPLLGWGQRGSWSL